MSGEPASKDVRPLNAVPPRRIFSTPAFASYIDGYQVPDAERLNEQLIVDILAWRDERNEGISASNHNGWHSPRDLYLRPEASFRELTAHTAAAATLSIRRYWPEFDPSQHGTFMEGWANINGPGAVNGPHAHSHQLSGVYYVKVPTSDRAREGAIEFLNPAGALTRTKAFDRKLVHPTLRLAPRAGQMFIFPGYLQHWVLPHYVEEERFSIAFNVAVESEPVGE
jgi:uncharacterized protein (TIGR02466 family)